MTALAIALRGRTFRSLRRHRNYRLFFTGQLISVAGTWMQNIALAWLVIQLSSSPRPVPPRRTTYPRATRLAAGHQPVGSARRRGLDKARALIPAVPDIEIVYGHRVFGRLKLIGAQIASCHLST